MVSPARLCVICKGGRNLCGNSPCPLLSRFRVAPKVQKSVSTEFFGPNYNIFVGRMGYPHVGIGPMAALEEQPALDSPGDWLSMDYQRIVELRSLLIRSRHNENVFSRSRFVQENQELAMASKPTDIEMTFRKKPYYKVSFSDVVQPMGPSAPLEKLRLAQNPKISRKVDYIVSDELKANQASWMLYRSGQDVYKITSILSSGALGMSRARKLVPTRWSITGVHSMIANKNIEEIKQLPQINEYRIYSSKNLDNHYQVLLMPGNWEFENFEAWAPGSTWSFNMKKTEILEEYEPFGGRTKYAALQGGGFYASRLGCTEGLKAIRKQARVVVFREIYEGYCVPVGVWQVLEGVRGAFGGPYLKFSTKEEALKHIDSKLRLPIGDYIAQSVILKQKKLTDFMGGE